MVSHDLILRNGILMTPSGPLEGDLAVSGGTISGIGSDVSGKARGEIDLKGDWLLPGMIDAHVHFNELGRTEWEGFATGSAAAAAGGVTMVFDMPLNSSPSLLSPERFRAKAAAAKANSRVKVKLWGGLTPTNLDQLEALYECGVVGFKAFMSASGIDDFPRVDSDALGRGMETVAQLPGMRVAVHAEDDALTARLSAERAAAGRFDARAFLESRPIEAELIAIRDALTLAEQTRCPLHIVHVSSAAGLALITNAKAKGIDVTAETCPHYLFLTETDLDRLGPLAKCAPPLRSAAEQTKLWEALCRGEVDTVGSDHSPCPPALKQAENFAAAWGGISGVQHSLPLLIDGLIQRGDVIGKAVELVSTKPATLFSRSENVGSLEIGHAADLCQLRAEHHTVARRDLWDRHRHSPYLGVKLQHRVIATWVEGNKVFRCAP